MANEKDDTIRTCLYSWGSGSSGQTGLTTWDDVHTPAVVDFSFTEDKVALKMIAAGASHSFATSANGTVYSWGWGANGQLGLGDTNNYNTPQQAKLFQGINVAQLACGWNNTLAITNDGRLYVCGCGRYGQTASPSSADVVVPSVVQSLEHEQLIHISCGLRHCVAVAKSGYVYTWGESKFQQLGFTADTAVVSSPHRLDPVRDFQGKRIVGAAAGQRHTVCISESGDVFVFGDNKYGQLGLCAQSTKSVTSPLLLNALQGVHICDIACGWSHTVGLSANRTELFAFGRNDHGQLGGSTTRKGEIVKLQICGSEITSFDCGSEHSVCTTIDGRLFSWGWNEHAQLGTGDELDREVPTEIPSFGQQNRVLSARCGGGHTLALVVNTHASKGHSNTAGQSGE